MGRMGGCIIKICHHWHKCGANLPGREGEMVQEEESARRGGMKKMWKVRKS